MDGLKIVAVALILQQQQNHHTRILCLHLDGGGELIRLDGSKIVAVALMDTPSLHQYAERQ